MKPYPSSDDRFTPDKLKERLRVLLASEPMTFIFAKGGGFKGTEIKLDECLALERGDVEYILQLLELPADQPVTVIPPTPSP